MNCVKTTDPKRNTDQCSILKIMLISDKCSTPYDVLSSVDVVMVQCIV